QSDSEVLVVADVGTAEVWRLTAASIEQLSMDPSLREEFDRQRDELVKSLPRRTFFVPLVRNIHLGGPSAVWLDLPWRNTIGVLVDSNGSSILVRPTARNENRSLIDSQLVGDTLYLLYSTTIMKYGVQDRAQ
ncbi:MAG TPA: hypothetical protein VK928_11780, partial [Longimicrobiales bacterium]|nr:hypothetical protein [Longimicrobiales bacterium]